MNSNVVQMPLTQETAKDLLDLLQTVVEHHLSLELMGQPVNQQNVFRSRKKLSTTYAIVLFFFLPTFS